MSELQNLTPFSAVCIPSLSRSDELLTLVVVSGCFVLPEAGGPAGALPRIADEPAAIRLVDQYRGHPATTSLLYEGQSTYTRPGTDIYLEGKAWSARGRAVTQSRVSLQVGPWRKEAVVFGERTWSRGFGGLTPSRPASFTQIPLEYERCFGGWPAHPTPHVIASAECNPVGRGLYNSESEARDGLLPNLEEPGELLSSPTERPRPCGFGPIARHWRPRRTFAGKYDPEWIEQQAPLWPPDLDERFFSAAAPGLLAMPYLQGSEPVHLDGVSPDGAYDFYLPQCALQVRFEQKSTSTRKRLVLDAVLIEPESSRLTLTWRAHITADPLTVNAAVVRCLASWELVS